MATEGVGQELGQAVALLTAGVIAVPVFRRLGLGSVLGYLVAGLAIGPFGLKLFNDPEAILHVAELGVVMFLFLIGLEMRPQKLWALRDEIFGLGAAQVLTCAVLLSGVAYLAGAPWMAAIIGASGFVLSSTAVIMKTLDEAGETATPAGQRDVSILLLEDLSIVPLLALVAVFATMAGTADAEHARPMWQSVLIGFGALAVLLAAGRFLLNPFFALLARAGAREVMTAAALLVVLGAALFMQWGGLSMAMGAFLAGVLLSDSVFRHQLEADIEPFRGILLGLFFLSVGMSLNVSIVIADWRWVLGGVLAFMAVKAIGIFTVARLFGANNREAVRRAVLFAQGGEFAFVLYAAALSAGVMDMRLAAIMTAIVILSMALTPLFLLVQKAMEKPEEASLEGIDKADGLEGRVLVIGFGRFAQIICQTLLAKGTDISIIDTDVEMIQVASGFGMKIYYGDGGRLDVLQASGAGTADLILVCVDKPDVADRIVELAKAEFPHAKLFVRAFDRGHSVRLVKAGVEYQIRETFESALTFGGSVLAELGYDEEEVAEVLAETRRRDEERFELDLAGGLEAGRVMIRGNQQTPKPTPFTVPRRRSQVLNEEAGGLVAEPD